MSITADLIDRMYPAQAADVRDPVGWVKQRLGAHLWSKQREIVESVRDHRHTAVRAAHGVGKSYVAACAGAHWLETHPHGEALVVVSAPTSRQISAILFRELSRAHARGELRGRITLGPVPEWKVGSQLIAVGWKPQDRVDADLSASAFTGLHSRYLLALLDEASGLEPWLFDAVDSLTTTPGSRVLAIGNPLDPASHFAKVCAPGSGWNSIKVSAHDTPAFTGEQVPGDLLEQLVSERWVEERQDRWGEESPLYRARVLGEFPDQASDALISATDVEAARTRELSGDEPGNFGCDVARSGSDETVIYRNHGGVLRLAHRAQGHDTMATTGRMAMLLREARGDVSAAIDVIGVGAGVYDRLREQGFSVIAFNSSARARRPDRFANRRAEAYWDLRDEFREGRIDLDPADDELAAQLLAIKWKVNSRGQIQIESKDEMRKRGVASPDRADAVAMAIGQGGAALSLPISIEPVRDSFHDFMRSPAVGLPGADGSLTDDLLEHPW